MGRDWTDMEGMRIVSDGTTEGTHVFLDDKEVQEITGLTWTFSPRNKSATVVIEISNVQIDAHSEVSEDVRRTVQALALH